MFLSLYRFVIKRRDYMFLGTIVVIISVKYLFEHFIITL